MTTAKLKTRSEDYRLRNKLVGYLRCGGYRGADSEGFHLIEVTCRPCGSVWIERARRVWMGHVTNCGCQGHDLRTIQMWLCVTRNRKETKSLNALRAYVDTATLDMLREPYYPDDWNVYWRFRNDVGLAPSGQHVLDVKSKQWQLPDPAYDPLAEWAVLPDVIDQPDWLIRLDEVE